MFNGVKKWKNIKTLLATITKIPGDHIENKALPGRCYVQKNEAMLILNFVQISGLLLVGIFRIQMGKSGPRNSNKKSNRMTSLFIFRDQVLKSN